MTSYEKVFSRSRLKMNDLKDIMTLDESDLLEVNTERLHSVVSDVRVQALFSAFSMNDEIQEFSFTLANPSNDFFDEEYVVDILALGIVIAWLRPQVESHQFIAVALGGKEEKMLNNKYKDICDRLTKLENSLYKQIRDRGYIHNSYLEES